MKLLNYISFLIFISLSCNFYGQSRPPIEVFTTKDYGAETQNWSISQSKDNYIYVANNKGLLEYNGANWQLYPSPNETIIRSVSVIDNLIYTGCNSEFGYWEKNEFGQLHYTSLSNKLNIEFLEDEEFWNIIDIDDYILFQSLQRIYIYSKSGNSYSIIDSDTIIYKVFKIDDSIFFQKTKDGLYKIENGTAKLISNDPIIRDNRLVNIFNKDGGILIETENEGFFILNNNTLSKWNISANKVLSEVSVFRSIQLKDKSYILGTRSDGILHLTATGDIDYNIDVIHGLSNNTVHSVYEDNENNIWLALENGINCINIKSPFSIFTDDAGKIGTVYTSAVHNDYLYLGTNQGLFYKQKDSNEKFKLIEEIQEAVWKLVELDNMLFCGHDSGTSIIKNNTAQKLEGIQQGTWDIKPIKNDTEFLLQGNYNGLYVLQKVNNKWLVRNKIQGFDLSSRYFEIHEKHIFVNHEYKGVFKIQVDSDFTEVLNVEKIPEIGKEINSSLIKYRNDLLFSYKNGILKYNSTRNNFIKDTVLSALYKEEDYTSGKLILNKESQKLWAFSKNSLNYLSPGKLSGMPKINTIPFSKLLPKGLTGYENISYLNHQKYLIGTSTGYIIIDLNKLPSRTYNISINSITKQAIDSNPEIVNTTVDGFFENKENDIAFSYSVAEFDKYIDTEYQYQLEGMYPKWSKWSTQGSVLFKNLSFGNYTFRVRARVGNVITENTESYTFYIDKPWYLTNIAIAIYAIVILLFSLFMHNIYKRYYRKQQEVLLQRTARELELKELENKQQFMRFNNEKLRQDIDNKNRELGISTMSLIKKNEFLNTIKKELLNVEEGKSIKHVIKIIDRNLNNTDDWNVFEEAFNNADKDFLKKIKSLHPELTSNDLRLCAYLRLNLSSKEIAPLLNISPRSVEVKRYRLRKKMDLKHESNLTDYILEI
ncbi:LuxR C-terminal-related transcriptional regulator [Tamlana sp. 2201CG12-4]|uniref:helix-turn-helix and ligand-binding sensor domain-containing protein n=1 Tax=Tamlana sp. 2201CG12-4 TaxID=3112582 RepID=UPI002DBE4957|nr:LuxR C-terminal-related transcriptional regulator [Tamlana sp. 2201CG12-4]MEC3906247.1 LuxR C-terminal-related transcriptional regulator [Tamlana sp. 2201CG12-4]